MLTYIAVLLTFTLIGSMQNCFNTKRGRVQNQYDMVAVLVFAPAAFFAIKLAFFN